MGRTASGDEAGQRGDDSRRQPDRTWLKIGLGGLLVIVAAALLVLLGGVVEVSPFGVAAIVAAVAFGAAMVGVLWLLANLASTVNQVTTSIEQATKETVQMLENANDTITGVNTELARVDSIVANVQQISHHAEGIAGVLQAAVTNPLIKGIAFVTGTRAAVKAARKVT